MSNQPSADDLDRDAEERQAREATGPKALRAGDVFRYKPPTTWAYHGVAVVSEAGDAWDTYTGPDRNNVFRHALSTEQLESAEFLGNLDDFETTAPYPFCWDDYSNEDTIFIPCGHYRERRYVRKDAIPSSERCLYRVDSKLQSAKYGVESAQREIELVEDALRKIGIALVREGASND